MLRVLAGGRNSEAAVAMNPEVQPASMDTYYQQYSARWYYTERNNKTGGTFHWVPPKLCTEELEN